MAKDDSLVAAKTASQLKSIYLIAGDEDFIAFDVVQILKNLFTEKKEADWESREWNKSEGPLKDVIDEFFSQGIFSNRLGLHLIIKHEAFKKEQKLLEAYWNSKPKDRLLVIQISDWHFKNRNSLKLTFAKKTLEPAKACINNRKLFENMPPWGQYPWDSELCQWVKKRAKSRFGLELAGADLLTLTERTGNDPGRLAGELEKLHLYLGATRKVTKDSINSLIPDSHSSPLQNLLDAVIGLNTKKIFQNLHHIEQSGLALGDSEIQQREAQTPIILSQLTDTVRWLITAKRFDLRHENPKPTIFFKDNPKIFSSTKGPGESMNTKAKAEKYLKASQKIRLDTLLHWQNLIHLCLRNSRQGKSQQNALFQLFVEMFKKKLIAR